MELSEKFVENENGRNVVIKQYNDRVSLTVFKKPVARYKYYDRHNKVDMLTGQLVPWTIDDIMKRIHNFKGVLSRSLKRIYDISDKNTFSYFMTVTFNRKYVDSSDAKAVQYLFNKIIKRLNYTYNGVAYLAIPEFHKDKENIHYHCLITFNTKPTLGKKQRTKKNIYFYTIQDKFKKKDCYITLEELNNGNNIHYLTKYLTKGHEYPLTRRYSCSRGLSRSRVEKVLYIAGEDAVKKFIYLKRAAKQLNFITILEAPKIANLCFNEELSQGLMPGRAGGLPPRDDLSLYGINREKYSLVFKNFIALAQEYENLDNERRENAKIFRNNKIMAETQREQLDFIF